MKTISSITYRNDYYYHPLQGKPPFVSKSAFSSALIQKMTSFPYITWKTTIVIHHMTTNIVGHHGNALTCGEHTKNDIGFCNSDWFVMLMRRIKSFILLIRKKTLCHNSMVCATILMTMQVSCNCMKNVQYDLNSHFSWAFNKKLLA